jgi:hypothetical protein
MTKGEGELSQCKRALQLSELRNSKLERELQELRWKVNSSSQSKLPPFQEGSSSTYIVYRKGVELATELGGSTNALLYFLFFITLLSKASLVQS